MQNNIPEEYLQHVVEKPEAIDMCPRNRNKMAVLAATLKVLGATKSLVFSEPEFFQKFGKWGKNSIRQGCKRYKVHVTVAFNKGSVYVWGKEMK